MVPPRDSVGVAISVWVTALPLFMVADVVSEPHEHVMELEVMAV